MEFPFESESLWRARSIGGAMSGASVSRRIRSRGSEANCRRLASFFGWSSLGEIEKYAFDWIQKGVISGGAA